MAAAAERSVRDLAQAKWQSSGLTDKTAAKLKLAHLTAQETAALGSNFQAAGSLHIPYFDVTGKPTGFYRIRYLEPLPGWAGNTERPIRYMQPAGTLVEVYMPPILPRPWSEILQDPQVTLYITEGELKAAAASQAGLPTLGLGGVDSWQAKRRGLEMLPVLAETNWQGRQVVIVYDSDAATNPNVVRAQRALARALLALGAYPRVASLPPGPGGAKQGLDDYLVANGPDALERVLEDAPPYAEADALWGMNEEVVYIKEPGIVVVQLNGQQMMPSNFVSHAYANRHYLETVITQRGQSVHRRSLAKRWLEWERRYELERVTYAPGQPRVYANQWNTWPGWGVEPKRGDIKPWKELMAYIFEEDKVPWQWFERWCAYPLQYPGTKLFTTVVLWGVHHGTGKSLVGYTLKDIYGKNGGVIKDDDLHASFNEWSRDKQFIMGEEVTGGDPRNGADRLKSIFTQEENRINVKYLPTYVVPDCIVYYLTSNHPDAFFLEDHDRRYFVHEVRGAPLDKAFYAAYDAWRRGGGVAALFYYLLHLDLGDWSPKAPAMLTASKMAMIVNNKSDLGTWVLALKEDPLNALRPLGERVALHAELLSAQQLLRAYDPENRGKVSPGGLARELKRSGFAQVNDSKPVKTSAGLMRLWAVRNVELWVHRAPKQCTAHWDSVFGSDAGKF